MIVIIIGMNLLRELTRLNPTKKSMKSSYEISHTIKGQLDLKKVYHDFLDFVYIQRY